MEWSVLTPIVATAGLSAVGWGVRKIHQHDTRLSVVEAFIVTQRDQHKETREDLGEIKQGLASLNEHIVDLAGRTRR